MLGEARKDSCHLRRRFALAEDHFRHAGAQGAVMIHFGEAEIFERKMAQAIHGLVGRELAPAHLLEIVCGWIRRSRKHSD